MQFWIYTKFHYRASKERRSLRFRVVNMSSDEMQVAIRLSICSLASADYAEDMMCTRVQNRINAGITPSGNRSLSSSDEQPLEMAMTFVGIFPDLYRRT